MFVSKKLKTTGMLRIVIKYVFSYSCIGSQIDQRVPKLAYDSSFFDASIGFSYLTAWPANAVLANK